MVHVNRRTFLLAAGMALAPRSPLYAAERMRLSLTAYSFHKQLDLAQKSPKLDLVGFIDRAAGWGFEAVELTSYFFAETTPIYLAKIKQSCEQKNLAISGTAVGNNFCLTDPVKRAKEKALVEAWIEHTAFLGGKTLRVFAGKLAKGDTEEMARERCIAIFRELCPLAEKRGVLLALENHGGITATPEQLLAIVRGVDHRFFGVNLDTGNFVTDDPYADLEKIAPFAVNVQLKTEIQPRGKPKQEADLPRLLRMLVAAKYRGTVALEYEAAEDPFVAVPRYGKQLRQLIAELS